MHGTCSTVLDEMAEDTTVNAVINLLATCCEPVLPDFLHFLVFDATSTIADSV